MTNERSAPPSIEPNASRRLGCLAPSTGSWCQAPGGRGARVRLGSAWVPGTCYAGTRYWRIRGSKWSSGALGSRGRRRSGRTWRRTPRCSRSTASRGSVAGVAVDAEVVPEVVALEDAVVLDHPVIGLDTNGLTIPAAIDGVVERASVSPMSWISAHSTYSSSRPSCSARVAVCSECSSRVTGNPPWSLRLSSAVGSITFWPANACVSGSSWGMISPSPRRRLLQRGESRPRRGVEPAHATMVGR